MNTGKIILAGILGSAVAFVLGWLVYGMVLADFYSENAGSATGVMKVESDFNYIAMVAGNVTYGFFFAILYGAYARIGGFGTGAVVGFVLGLLIAASYNLIGLGSTNVMNMTAALVDIPVNAVISGLVGGVVGGVLGKEHS